MGTLFLLKCAKKYVKSTKYYEIDWVQIEIIFFAKRTMHHYFVTVANEKLKRKNIIYKTV